MLIGGVQQLNIVNNISCQLVPNKDFKLIPDEPKIFIHLTRSQRFQYLCIIFSMKPYLSQSDT